MNSFVPSVFAPNFSQTHEDSILHGFTDINICGEGASCVVYRMRLQGLHVAVKRLRSEFLTHPVHIASYKKEFQLGQRLKHEALPVYRELIVDTNDVYIIMDYIDGVSLNDFLDSDLGLKYFSTPENVRKFLFKLLDVVEYLHRSGVVHCDIKPANIMLRHSDRSVMLIDLDKAYSDSMDLTHGGTAEMSDPLTGGQKPTVQKDFSALGNLIEFLSHKVAGFPNKSFKSFRKECSSENATYESLIRSLNHQSLLRPGIIIPVVSLTIVILNFIIIYSTRTSEPLYSPHKRSPDTFKVIERVIEPINVESVPQPAKPNISGSDVDDRMKEFIRIIKDALTKLESGELSDKEILDMTSSVIESHSINYQKVITGYKNENPQISGMNVELAVSRAFEKSNSTKLLHQFTQDAADTIALRHKEDIIN